MSHENGEVIETLLAKEGKNPGECIGTYGRRCIVFLPKGCVADQSVRVKLMKLDKTDSRGNPMYRSVPAPDVAGEIWRMDEAGQAVRATTMTDWLGHTSEVGVMETRPLAKREGTPSEKSDYRVVWGGDLTTSHVEETKTRLVPLEEERVADGKLVWTKVSERTEQQPPVRRAVVRLVVRNQYGSDLRLYDPIERMSHTALYSPDPPGIDTLGHSFYATAAEMPLWWQKDMDARYPICSCRRQRRDTQVSDGYGKCEFCRAEDTCSRCGKKTKVVVTNGNLVCAECKPLEEAELVIVAGLTSERREAIASMAKLLRTARAIEQAGGEAVMRAMAEGIANSYEKRSYLEKSNGFGWYYFFESGVIYGSKHSPAALLLYEHMPKATGNGLVMLVGWFAGGEKCLPTDEMPSLGAVRYLVENHMGELAVCLRDVPKAQPTKVVAPEASRRQQPEPPPRQTAQSSRNADGEDSSMVEALKRAGLVK